MEAFAAKLQKPTRAKWLHTITLLKQYGRNLGMPHARKIKGDLYELRIRGTQEVRAFSTCVGDNIFIVHAFIKKTQKTPQREIQTAEKRLQQLLT